MLLFECFCLSALCLSALCLGGVWVRDLMLNRSIDSLFDHVIDIFKL